MKIEGLEISSGLAQREASAVGKLLTGWGFEINWDESTGLLTASRPEVIDRQDFIESVVTGKVDSAQFAGIAWSSLLRLEGWRNIDDPATSTGDVPLKTISSGPSHKHPNHRLLIADSLPPTVDWVQSNREVLPWVNQRRIDTWQYVADSVVIPTNT